MPLKVDYEDAVDQFAAADINATNTAINTNTDDIGDLSGWAAKTAPSGTVVGTSDTQALTNKDMSGAGNTWPTFNQNTTGSAAKLTTARTIGGTSFDGSANISQPYDLSIMGFGGSTARAVGYGDNPIGVKLQRAATLTSVTFRAATADASGNLVVTLRKNGSLITGTSTTIAAANQVAGGTSTGTWACNAGDIITIYVTGVGTTPGNGLVADITGTCG